MNFVTIAAGSVLGLVIAVVAISFITLQVIAALLALPLYTLFASRREYVILLDQFCNYVWSWMVWGVENYAKVECIFSGDEVPLRESAIIIANHQYAFDWLMLFSLASRKGRLGCCKFFAKDVVKYVPGVGWGLFLCDSVFLKRNWTKDQDIISRTFYNLKEHNLPVWLISWPEGTRMCPSKKKLAHKYAEERGLPKLEHVLLPRTKGFAATVQELRDELVEAVYDVTVGYPRDSPPGLFEMAAGNLRKQVHLHVRRYPIDSLPLSEEGLSNWCVDRFIEKDALLDHFKKVGCFPGSTRKHQHCRTIPMDLRKWCKHR